MDIIAKTKELADLIQKYNNQDLYQRIVELRDEIIRLKEENIQLIEEMNQLKKNENISAELYKDGNVYYRQDKDGKKTGPYCLTCWDGDKKLMNMKTDFAGDFYCDRCSKVGGGS